MRLLARTSLVLAPLLILAACSSGGDASPSAASPSAASPAGTAGAAPGATVTIADLDGRTFVSTAIAGHTLAPGSTVRLTFDGGHLGASAGCNQMSGAVDVVGGSLTVGMLATTEMACPEPLMSQDMWLASFLPGAGVALDGDTLTLTNAGVTLTLVDDEVANPDQSLEGPRWVVDGTVAGDAVSSVPAGAAASLVFDGGTVTVDTGCNTGSGTYTLADGAITFGPIATTRKACADDVMALEAAVVQVLSGQAAYAIDAGTLTLTNGTAGLVLKAAS